MTSLVFFSTFKIVEIVQFLKYNLHVTLETGHVTTPFETANNYLMSTMQKFLLLFSWAFQKFIN